jgi:hypothetical protein
MTRERWDPPPTQVIALPATDDARASLIWLHGAGLGSKARAMYEDDTARGPRPAPPRPAARAARAPGRQRRARGVPRTRPRRRRAFDHAAGQIHQAGRAS